MTDDRLHAVLTEPQLARFREVCSLDGEALETDFSGWHRRAITSRDRVFLFPRDHRWVRSLLREAVVLQAIDGRGVPAPHVLGSWQERDISPYPFLCLSKLPGRPLGRLPGKPGDRLEGCASLADAVVLMRELGRTIATWHRIDAAELPTSVQRRRRTDSMREFAARLTPAGIDESAHRAATAAGMPATRARQWSRELKPLAAMRRVLVHGDIHEGQLLVDGALKITGVLDWETAHVSHPLKDFSFGDWGFAIFTYEEHFGTLRHALWESYRQERGGDLPDWHVVHLFFCVTELAYLSQQSANDSWTRQRIRQAKHLLTTLEG